MTTVRGMEKLWNAGAQPRLLADLLEGRPESALLGRADFTSPAAIAALALIRLDELSQNHVPLYGRLLRQLLAMQGADGGWVDPMTTALCLRALLNQRGDGLAIERALTYLAQLQKPDGLWPAAPIRRMPADAYVSAFILLQLGNQPRFASAVRVADAVRFFESNIARLDTETRKLWSHAALRCRSHRAMDAQMAMSWS